MADEVLAEYARVGAQKARGQPYGVTLADPLCRALQAEVAGAHAVSVLVVLMDLPLGLLKTDLCSVLHMKLCARTQRTRSGWASADALAFVGGKQPHWPAAPASVVVEARLAGQAARGGMWFAASSPCWLRS